MQNSMFLLLFFFLMLIVVIFESVLTFVLDQID